MDKLTKLISKLTIITGTRFEESTLLYDCEDNIVIWNNKYSLLLDKECNMIDGKHYTWLTYINGLFLVQIDLTYYMIDSKGNRLTKVFNHVYAKKDGAIITIIKENNEKYYGAIDITGKEIIKNMYLELSPFNEGLAICRKKDLSKWWIDKQGNELLKHSSKNYKVQRDKLIKMINNKGD